MRLARALPLLAFLACQPRETAAPAPAALRGQAGNIDRGRQLVTQYGCNVCHRTPGVGGPQGAIGPSLAGVASRPRLSGNAFPNTPENMAKFIQAPASMNPSSAMPPLAVTPDDARDLVAYLMTLK